MAASASASTGSPSVALLQFRRGNDSAIVGVSQSEEIDIGRDSIRTLLDVQDRSISTHHLRLHCIAYEDDQRRVAPLVYIRVLSNNPVILQQRGPDACLQEKRITKGHGDVLLDHDDRILLTNQISFHFSSIVETRPHCLDGVQIAEVEQFARLYHVTSQVIGIGGYAAVYAAVRKSDGQQVACKVVDLRAIPDTSDYGSEDPHGRVAREYDLLKCLSHPNIITLEKVFRSSTNVYLFQELVTGGDLLSYLDRTGRLSEPRSAVIVRQLLEAVKYLHANQIVHRDIKPENILMTCWRDGGRILLSDFGQARTITDMEHAAKRAGVFRMQSKVGTHGYAAPEIALAEKQKFAHGCGYSKAVDIWSVGCVTTTVLTNDWIFDNKESQIESIHRRLRVIDGSPVWDEIGHRAKSFVRACLAIDEKQRPSAEECLHSAWFRHPHYQAEFDALYERSIADWQPQMHKEDLIEYLQGDDPQLGSPAVADDEDARSHYFPVLTPTILTPGPITFTDNEQSAMARFRSVQHPASESLQHRRQSQVETSDGLSPFPAPPSLHLTTQMQMNRAHNFQKQFAPTDTIDTQILPKPPNFDTFQEELQIAPIHAFKTAPATARVTAYR